MVTVLTNDGRDHPITLNATGEMQISGECLTVLTNASTTYINALNEVYKVLFVGQVNFHEVEASPTINAYPNPAGFLFVLLSVLEGQHQLSIYNAYGTQVLSTNYKAPISEI